MEWRPTYIQSTDLLQRSKDNSIEQRQFNKWYWNIYMQQTNKNPSLHIDLTYVTKINLKWIIGPRVKHKIIKHLEDNIGYYLDDLGYDFLDKIPKA